jgi:hypothetical protein
MCLAKQEQVQTVFDEKALPMRTIANYNNDIASLLMGNTNGRVHVHGIKKNCVLNKLAYFHVLQKYALDPMHIILEGIVPLELGCILYYLITVKKLFSLNTLNKSIVNFFKKNFVDKKNMPPELNAIEQPGNGLSPSMKATQLWALIRFLPLVIGDYVPEDDEHWEFLIHLSHLVDLVFAPRFTPAMINYLDTVIFDHLTMFKDLFGDKVRLKAKHHLLVHFPTVIRKSGPLVGMCCLRYELKNCFFKRSASIMSNFINVCKTLAYRHQCYALFTSLNFSRVRDYLLPSKISTTILSSCRYCDAVITTVGCEATDSVYTTYKINKATLEYKIGSSIVIGEENDVMKFGKIVAFVSVSLDVWFVVVQIMETMHFDNHRQVFVARMIPSFAVVNFDNLIDHHPLYCHEIILENEKCSLIRMPYHVIVC